jgi:MFS family permease
MYPIMMILKIFGIVFFIVTIACSLYLRFPPAGWKPAGWTPPAPAAGAAPRVDFMRNEMTKTGTFKGLWLCYTIGALAGLTAIGIVGPVGNEVMANAGMTKEAAGTLVFALILPFAICNGIGRPIFGMLTDKLTPRNTAMLSYVLIILACLMMYMSYSSTTMFAISFAILWLCLGGWLAIAPTATASFFGMKDNAKNYGLVFTAYGAGAIIGGIAAALMAVNIKPAAGATILEAYRPFFLLVAALAAAGIVVAYMMMKPPVKKTA